MPSNALPPSAVELGGVAGVLAAALFVLSTILARVAPTGLTYESATDYLHEILLVGAFGAPWSPSLACTRCTARTPDTGR